MNTEEMTIDLMDLLRRCLLRWKFIVVWMLIGAIAMDGFGILKSVQEVKSIKAQIQQSEEEDASEKQVTINEYMQKLTEREISEVQTAVLSYKAYQQEYVDGLKYYQESMKMKLDPSCVPTLRLQYIIDTHYEVTYPVMDKKDMTQDIISVLAEKIKSETVSNAVAEALGNQIDAAYVQELLTTSADDENAENDTFVINIIAENRDDCEKIAEIVKNTVNESLEAVRETCGAFDIRLASEQSFETSNKDLMAAQQSAVTSLNTLKSSVTNLLSGMTEDQKVYYYALLDNEQTIDVSASDESSSNEEKLDMPELTIPEIQYISMRYILIGLVLGAIVACGWITVKYLMSGKLRTSSDLVEGLGLPVIGNISENHVKIPWLFKKPYHRMATEEQMDMIVSEISIAAEKEKMNNIFITSAAMTERSKEICEKLCEKLGENGVAYTNGSSVLYDAQQVRKLADADGVVFVEQIDASRVVEIVKEKEISMRMHTKVIGYVVVE